MANELTFELETISDKTNGTLAVCEYEKTLANAQAIIDANPVVDIHDDFTKRQYKDIRATFNKIVKAIDRKRIDTLADYAQAFEEQCLTLKNLFDERQKAFGEKIKEYEESQKEVVGTSKAKVITATIKFTDEKLVKKLTDFCTKNNCELTIK